VRLRPQERRLLELVRAIGWGQVTVKVQNGVPVLAVEIRRMVKLDRQLGEWGPCELGAYLGSPERCCKESG